MTWIGMYTMKLLSTLLRDTQSLTSFKAPCPVLPANSARKAIGYYSLDYTIIQHQTVDTYSAGTVQRNGSKGQLGFIISTTEQDIIKEF